MKEWKVYFSVLVIIILIFTSNPMTVKGTNDTHQSFSGYFDHQKNALKNQFEHLSGAFESEENSKIIDLMANTLLAATLFQEYQAGGNDQLVAMANQIMATSTKYFSEVYTSDHRGWVVSYDFVKEDSSYVKSRKFTHEQFLMLLALSLSYTYLDADALLKPEFLALFNSTRNFISEELLTNPWTDSLFIFNTTYYTRNKLQLVEHICWTIWASLSLSSSFGSPLELTNIRQIVEILHEQALKEGGIANILNPVDNATDEIHRLRTNALYGITNLMLYEATSESKYLTRSRVIFDFLYTYLWDPGFGGFFDVVEDGLLAVQGKSLIGNSLACVLTTWLLKYYPTDLILRSIYVRSNSFIDQYLMFNNQLFYLSGDRDGDPLQVTSLLGNVIRLWQRHNSLHIIKGILPTQVSIGDKLEVELKIANPGNLNYTLYISGDDLIPYNITTSDNTLDLQLSLKPTAQVGRTSVQLTLKVLQTTIDATGSIYYTIGSDRRLPQGIVYIIAIGILLGVVVITRYPPKRITDLLGKMSSIGIEEEGETPDTTGEPHPPPVLKNEEELNG